MVSRDTENRGASGPATDVRAYYGLTGDQDSTPTRVVWVIISPYTYALANQGRDEWKGPHHARTQISKDGVPAETLTHPAHP